MPGWVIAEWYEPDHWGCLFNRGEFECDLPDSPVRQHPNPPRYGEYYHCRWSYEWPWRYGRRSYRHGGVPKWYVDHVWNGPERVRERDDLRALRDEYNAHGDLEDGDFPCWQTRSFARWMRD